jgi:hypothetical protein
MHGNVELLTDQAWEIFQRMFEENGFEVYESRGLVIVEQTVQQKEAENRKLTINELTERIRDGYTPSSSISSLYVFHHFCSIIIQFVPFMFIIIIFTSILSISLLLYFSLLLLFSHLFSITYFTFFYFPLFIYSSVHLWNFIIVN